MTRLGVTVLLAELVYEFLDVELGPLAPVEFAQADLYFRPQCGECIDPLKQFATDLLLRGLRKSHSPGQSQFE
jgi:hypothetical protein